MLKTRAYTLIETLLCLGLISILLCFSLPHLSSLHQKNQMEVIQDDLKSAIRFAKTEALINDSNLILTPMQDTNDWSHGMLLFIDNTKHHYTQDDTLLREWHWHTPNVQVAWHGFQSSEYLLFSADASRNAMNGRFVISTNDKSKPTVKLVVNRLGRVRRE